MARGATSGQRSKATVSVKAVPVVVQGLGAIGQLLVRAAVASEELELIGAVDAAPVLVGRKVGELCGTAAGTIKVTATLAEAVGRRKGVVVLQAIGSRMRQVEKSLHEAIDLGCHVVSTCEELAFPYFRYPELADALDRRAQKAGVVVLGTGVNPGFLLDRLVATLGQACGPVRHVKATRIVDALTRRPALQRKIGSGLSEDEFFKLVDAEQLGHVGLVESAALAALGVGLDCDDYEEEIFPVLAEEDIEGSAFKVKAGQVAGLHQVAVGLADGQERVRLELTIALGAENAHDTIEIDADPPVRMVLEGGVRGDLATANLAVNAAARVVAAEPGLMTVLELPAGR